MSQPKCKTMTLEERKARVAELARLFNENKTYYLSKEFNEANCRGQFIDVLLECLGWDVKNEKGARPDKREVIPEDRVTIDNRTKHPDYSLCFGGIKKIYVEAKQPSVDLKKDPAPALQVRRYAYTSKMPIAILTDFQEFAVYDTRIKPNSKDTAGTARIGYYTFEEYAEKFEELYNRFSYEAVDLGKFDTYFESAKDKKGTASVDDDILSMIERWRLLLAEDIALHNAEIDEYNLTSSVQKIIDRILFLRICEDKEIEEYDALGKIARSKNGIYPRLQKLFDAADKKFNSGLFAKDDFTDSLSIQDKTLESIVGELYYPKCPYEFSVLPVEILGSIYERFLGKIIRFSRKTKNGHSVEVVEKPEVQKAGGVYYTPTYIVNYIVENTIGKKIAGRTPEQIAKMRFVDPACGSGSFLIGAYQYLLAYHLDYYDSDKNRARAEKSGIIYKDSATLSYKLSVEEKKRILLNNIYGVDIDAQAVEVTKLSLFLKLLENEGKALSQSGMGEMFRSSDLAQNKILPDMRENIKCGNSLIGSDFYADKNLLDFCMEEQRKVNAFDWEKEFPQVFTDGGSLPLAKAKASFATPSAGTPRNAPKKTRAGGFDCVIGNPPYLRVQGLRENYEEEAKFYEQNYQSATGRFDFYVLFLEKGFTLLNKDGYLSFICPHKFLNSDFGVGLRSFIYKNRALNFLTHFGSEQVFSSASVYTCVIGLSHQNKNFSYAQVIPTEIENGVVSETFPIEKLSDTSRWSFQTGMAATVLETLHQQKNTVKEVFKGIYQGIVTGDNKVFYLENCTETKKFITGYSEALDQDVQIEKGICKPVLTGKTIQRYSFNDKKEYMIYPYYKKDNGKTVLYEEQELKNQFPYCYEYFSSLKKRLASRGSASMKYPSWYSLWNFRNIDNLSVERILTPDVCYGATMYLDSGEHYHNDTSYAFVLKNPDSNLYKTYLAILNSPIIWFYLKETGTSLRGGYFRFKTKYLENFPLPTATPEQQQTLAALADQMLAAHTQLASAKSDADKKTLQQRIAILDLQINAQVYALYGLSSEEIAVVEGA